MRVLVTGSNGLVGHAIKEVKDEKHEFLFTSRKDGSLISQSEVDSLFASIKPDCVIHAAAKVGGIGGNASGPADYYRENILMNTHVLHAAQQHGVKKFLALSSVCVFADGIDPLREDLMHKDFPYQSEFAYGFAKRAMDVQIAAIKQQHGLKNYTSLILTNLFGKNDSYNLQNGHVIPSLIHKMYIAKRDKVPMRVWGTGKASREFLYAEDLAKMILKMLYMEELPQRVIVSRNEQVSIKEVVDKLCEISGFGGEIIWETDKPEGQRARETDLSVLNSLIEPQYTNFDVALEESYRWFEETYPNVRM